MHKILKIVFFITLIAFNVFPQAKITPGKAKSHVGEEVIIIGKIDQVVKSATGNYFFNMGGKFPHNKFTAVIFKAEARRFGRLNTYEGKEVEIFGKIKEYNGKPEIVLDSLNQIKIIEKRKK